ncbi:MAG: hypothetical protein ACTSRI_05755 [Promethearchaeota archaeon]
MSNFNKNIDKDFFLERFEKLSLKLEQLTDEISKMKIKLGRTNRTFGLKALRNSEPLEFAKGVKGVGSPTKEYILSIRAITGQWKGRKNDILITISQQEKDTKENIKALGIRIPISDIKNIRNLTKEIISLLYIACELKGIEITEILREVLQDINKNGYNMIQEIRQKMIL